MLPDAYQRLELFENGVQLPAAGTTVCKEDRGLGWYTYADLYVVGFRWGEPESPVT